MVKVQIKITLILRHERLQDTVSSHKLTQGKIYNFIFKAIESDLLILLKVELEKVVCDFSTTLTRENIHAVTGHSKGKVATGWWNITTLVYLQNNFFLNFYYCHSKKKTKICMKKTPTKNYDCLNSMTSRKKT